MINAKYQLATASPGAILREKKRPRSSLGLEAEKLRSQGKMLPNELVNGLVCDWLQNHEDAFVFDSYRSADHTDAHDGMHSRNGRTLDLVALLKVNLATIPSRVANRMTCAACGWIGVHVLIADADCPRICGRLVKRCADRPEAFKARMFKYVEETDPLISRYRDHGFLRSVNAGRPPEIVFDAVSKTLETE